MQETWVRALGREDPLEKEMATHSSILAWRIPWTEEPGGGWLQSMGSQRVRYDWVTKQQQQQWIGRCLKASILACSVPLMCSAMYSLQIQVKWDGIPFKYCRLQLGSKILKPQSSVAANSEQCVLGTHFSQHNHEQAIPWLLWVSLATSSAGC